MNLNNIMINIDGNVMSLEQFKENTDEQNFMDKAFSSTWGFKSHSISISNDDACVEYSSSPMSPEEFETRSNVFRESFDELRSNTNFQNTLENNAGELLCNLNTPYHNLSQIYNNVNCITFYVSKDFDMVKEFTHDGLILTTKADRRDNHIEFGLGVGDNRYRYYNFELIKEIQ